MHPLRLLSLAAMFLVAPAFAQPGPPPACETPEHRQFDFWLGEWEVTGGPKLALSH